MPEEVIEKYLRNNIVIGHSQLWFMRGRFCLINLIAFYDKITYLVYQGKPVVATFVDFSEAFDTVSQRILLDKTSSLQLDRNIKNERWLIGWAQKVMGNGVLSGWWPSVVGFPRAPFMGHFSSSFS